MAEKEAADAQDEQERQQQAIVKRWFKKIEAAQEGQKPRHAKFETWRKYIKGEVHTGPQDRGANIIFANHATVLPYIYARNPEIQVAPAESVDPERYTAVRKFCRTMQVILNRCMVKDAKLKRRAKAAVRSVLAVGDGWLKMAYLREWEDDPQMRAQLDTAQKNLKRIEYLLRKINDPSESEQAEAEKAELEQQIKALADQVEVVKSEGLVIDVVASEDMLILDASVKEFGAYVDARAIAQRIWWTKEEYEELFGWPEDGKSQPKIRNKPIAGEEGNGRTNQGEQWICGWEVWDKASNTVYTLAEGKQDYCREPFQPKRLGERWYPFFRWGWNVVDGTADPVSDTELQRSLQDEYYESRTQYADHRKDSMPVRLVRKSGNLTPEDVDKITHRKSRDMIPVEGLPGKPISDDIGELPGVTLNPAVYDTGAIRTDMELMAGRGDAAAGTVANAKTATEAEILREGLQTRSQERRDGIEDELQEMAQYAAEILLQELTPEQVQRIAGADATWPQASKEEIFDLVEIDIRAGSTGLPNKAREREQWTQVLPLIKETVMQIAQAEQQQMPQMATALKKLLKETLQRYDERIDLEEFLPAQEGTPEAAQQEALMQAQQRIQELEQQLQQVVEQGQTMLQEEVAKAKQEGGAEAKAIDARSKAMQADYQAREKEAQRQADLAAKKAEAEAKAQADRDAKIKAAEIAAEAQKEIARDRLAFEREKEALAKLAEIVTADAQRAQVSDDNAQATAEAVEHMGEGMQQQIDAVQAAIAMQNEVRDRRTMAVLEYLSGPRTPDRLQAAVQQITTVH